MTVSLTSLRPQAVTEFSELLENHPEAANCSLHGVALRANGKGPQRASQIARRICGELLYESG